jgi:thiamine phosphate synthase YjbQ (UPF0047 family)
MKRIDLQINTHKLFTDITSRIHDFLVGYSSDGLLNIYSKHTTCGLFLGENEPYHLADIRFLLDSLVPYSKTPEGAQRNIKYLHDLISLRENVGPEEPLNGHSHLRRLFFDSQLTLPVFDGRVELGDWSSIFFVELDPGRARTIIVSLLESS